MANRTMNLTDELYSYLVAHGSEPDEIAADLLAETRAAHPQASGMATAPEQAAFLTLLTRLLGVRNAVEIGTFTGFSSLAIGRGLADGGRLICLDRSEKYTSIAVRYWQRAGLADRIELRLGPGAETVRQLPTEAAIDLAFIDADKSSYQTYWDELVPRMRPGGVVLVDNVLWDGGVLGPRTDDARAVAAFNETVLADDRVEAVMLPIADGLTMARRR